MTTLQDIKNFIDRNEKFKGCYFWTRQTSASERRRTEKNNQLTLDFRIGKDIYHAEQSVTCSCKNTYYNQKITKNGVETNITVLKTILKKQLIIDEVTP